MWIVRHCNALAETLQSVGTIRRGNTATKTETKLSVWTDLTLKLFINLECDDFRQKVIDISAPQRLYERIFSK